MALLVPFEEFIACLGLLWVPACLVAQFFARRGDRLAHRALFLILPAQLVLAYSLTHAGKAVGLTNMTMTFALISLALSAAGGVASMLVHQLEHF